MLSRTRDDHQYVVHYRSYRLALLLLLLPPLMLIEHLPAVIDGSIDASDLAALLIGVFVPLLAAYLLIELSSFTFLQADNIFRFRWRNPLRKKALDLPLDRIVSVRRQVMERLGLVWDLRLPEDLPPRPELEPAGDSAPRSPKP